MKVLFVGVLDVEWSTNCSMKRALESCGHTVTAFNYRTVAKTFCPASKKAAIDGDRYIDKLASFLRSARIPLNTHWYYSRNGRREMNKLFLETVKNNDFDLVLLSKTDTVDYDLIPEINKYTRTWYYFMDPMDQAIRINAAAYAKNATWASATFSDVTEYFKNKGANAYWITQGVDTDIFKPRQAIKVYDVVFAGTRTARRFQYVNILRKNGIAVKCFGEGWENNPIYNEELVDIYRKSKIVLNFCREGCGFSIRVFQVMGTGTFIMSEYCNDLEHFFQRGKHLDWFKDSVELEEKILFYLSHGEEREKIAKGGCNFVLSQHSWNEVMKEVIRIVETS